MDKIDIVNICARGWSLPFLVAMLRGENGRMSMLASALGCSRGAARDTLLHLLEHELVQRHGGVGHPLRPEFHLTEKGRLLAACLEPTMPHVADQAISLIRLKWSLPILVTLGEPLRFNSLARQLPQSTDRALSQTLGRLENASWVHRRVDAASRPVAVEYSAAGRGAKIGDGLREALTA